MRIMTYNIQHGADYHFPAADRIDLGQVASVIRGLAPAFCGLNEVRGKGTHPKYTEQARSIGEALGWEHRFAKATLLEGGNPYGNGLVSSLPILETEVVPIPDPQPRGYDGYYETRCVMRTVLDAGRPFTVFLSHFGLNPDEARSAVDTMLHLVTRCPTPCAVMGDFNLTPEDPILQPLLSVMQDTADFARDPLLTFPSDRPDRKIDYILVSRDVTVHSARVPVLVASDHCPYVADISF